MGTRDESIPPITISSPAWPFARQAMAEGNTRRVGARNVKLREPPPEPVNPRPGHSGDQAGADDGRAR